jgi:hypothetical protein
MRRRKEWHEAERAPPRALGDEAHAVVEQARVAAKLVDEEADNHLRILRRDDRLRADELGDDAAAVDVADDYDGRLRRPGEPHVGDVAFAQVDFGGAAGPLDQHQIGRAPQARVAVEHGTHQPRRQIVIVARRRRADDAALHDDLRANVTLRFQQHRIHVDARGDAAGARLQGLGAADLAAVRRHGGVVRHVLRLERPHAHAPRREGAAEAGDDQRLADIRAGALKHQRARLAHVSRLLDRAAPAGLYRPKITNSVSARSQGEGARGPL